MTYLKAINNFLINHLQKKADSMDNKELNDKLIGKFPKEKVQLIKYKNIDLLNELRKIYKHNAENENRENEGLINQCNCSIRGTRIIRIN